MTTTTEPTPKPLQNFTWPVRVYWQDTDAGGIVYHPNYLSFALKARSEFLRAHFGSETELYKQTGMLLVVRHAEIDYRASAKLDDLLQVGVELEKVGNSSFTLIQPIKRAGQLLATVKVVLVAINDAGAATRIPPQLRQIFES